MGRSWVESEFSEDDCRLDDAVDVVGELVVLLVVDVEIEDVDDENEEILEVDLIRGDADCERGLRDETLATEATVATAVIEVDTEVEGEGLEFADLVEMDADKDRKDRIVDFAEALKRKEVGVAKILDPVEDGEPWSGFACVEACNAFITCSAS